MAAYLNTNPSDDRPIARSVPEAAKIIGIGTSLAWQLVRDGKIKATRIGGRTLVSNAEIARVVEEGA
jgi:excisionase family DNA binding protein